MHGNACSHRVRTTASDRGDVDEKMPVKIAILRQNIVRCGCTCKVYDTIEQ